MCKDQKASDNVKWTYLWRTVHETERSSHLVALTKLLYEQKSAQVHIEIKKNDKFCVETGSPTCILSPLLLNIYGRYAMRKATEDCKEEEERSGRS